MTKEIEILSKAIYDCTHQGVISYDGKTVRFKFPLEKKQILEDGFSALGATFTFFQNEECEFELNRKFSHHILIYFDEKAFLNHIKSFIAEFASLNIVIIKGSTSPLWKYPGEHFTQEKAIFFNTVVYRELIDLIASNADFISFHDSQERRFLLISGDSGPFFVGYDRNDPGVGSLPNLQRLKEKLKKDFAMIGYVKFFKDAVIQGIHSFPPEIRFLEMVKSLEVLLEIATRDHNIYLKQFGFDKIKARFKEERVKYFEGIEKNIEAVSRQVTSFPLTFAASIFAGYQVKEKSFILFLILGAYLLYSIIAWKVLDVVAFNRAKIKEDVDHEEASLKKQYKIVYDDFKSDFVKIKDKLDRLKTLICLLRFVLMMLFLAFAAFCIYERCIPHPPAPPVQVHIVS